MTSKIRRPEMKKIELLLQFFDDKKVVLFDDMKELLADTSEISIRKYLKTLNAQSSVNGKGRYYIIPSQHVFAEDGLLRFRKVIFHRDNTLLKAIVSLINGSPVGLNTAALDKLLLTETRFQLAQLFKKKLINREGSGGAGSYIYYSNDESVATAQKQHGLSLVKQVADEEQKLRESSESIAERQQALDKNDVIDVMQTLLQHPDFTAKGVGLSLQRRGKKIGFTLVREIFEAYGLKGKKS